MRVLFVITLMGRGGAEVQVRDLALSLAERGHVVAVVAMMWFEDFEEELRRAGVATTTLGMKKGVPSLGALGRLAAFARAFDPEIVHAHMFPAILLCRTTRLLPRPARGSWNALISTSHTQGGERSRLRYAAYRLTSRLSERWTSVSHEGLRAHQAAHALGGHPAEQFPNGIDVTKFSPDAKRRAETRGALGVDDAFFWLSVGSFRDESKDFPTLLRAFARTSGNYRQHVLMIAGEGRLLHEMQELAAALSLEDRVRFLGLRRDIPGLLNAADAYVLSSSREGMPIVLLEAAASALPIVSTNVGACSDIVVDGEGGRLVPPGDVERLAEAMDFVERAGEEGRRELGRVGREHVRKRYDLSSIVTRWEDLYRAASRRDRSDRPP